MTAALGYNSTIIVEPLLGRGGRGDIFGSPFRIRCRVMEQDASAKRDNVRSSTSGDSSVPTRWKIEYRRGAVGHGVSGEPAGIPAGSKITLPDGTEIRAVRTRARYGLGRTAQSYETIAR